MMAVTSLEHVIDVLQVAPSPAIQQGYRAAESAVASGCLWPAAGVPEALVEAVVLRTGRYLARQQAPSGVVGVGDFGPVRMVSVDRDIEELEGPWRRMDVFG